MGELAPTKAIRGAVLHFLDDPSLHPDAFVSLPDGLLVIEDGHIKACGPAETLLAKFPSVPVTHFPGSLILPGLVDTHVHYPQTEMMASRGANLLDWLTRYTFAIEDRFSDKAHCERVARFFVDQLLRHGTTTALVFSTVHKVSADCLFEEAQKKNLRLITGKVCMDRNAPASLLDTPESAYTDSLELIRKWHGKGRLHYALTPRFAPTSSESQLERLSKLHQEFPTTYVQTHLSENKEELKWVSTLFPKAKNYLDVYDTYGLLGERSVFAHSLHLCDDEFSRLEQTGSAVAFCPSSNLFLGSGIFNLHKAAAKKVRFGIGTDVGAGTSFSILNGLAEAYKVAQLQNYDLTPLHAFYLATLGGARALRLDSHIGNFEVGKEADFIVLDPSRPLLLGNRYPGARDLTEQLLVLMNLSDDRSIRATYVLGELSWDNPKGT